VSPFKGAVQRHRRRGRVRQR